MPDRALVDAPHIARCLTWARSLAPEITGTQTSIQASIQASTEASDRSTGMASSVTRQSAWSLTFLAALLYEAGHGLPWDDTWCRLSLTLDLCEIAGGDDAYPPVHLEHSPTRSPSITGATHPSGLPFGGPDDWDDLGQDTLRAALGPHVCVPFTAASPLSRLSAALVGLASHDPATVRRCLAQTHAALTAACAKGILPDNPGTAVVAVVEPALRWLLTRRLAQHGKADDFWLEATANAVLATNTWADGAPIGDVHFVASRWRLVSAGRARAAAEQESLGGFADE